MSEQIINEVVNVTTGETYLDLTEDTVSESNLLLNQTAHNSEGEAIVGTMQAGTSDYSALTNKPQINDVELDGNLSSSDLGLVSISDLSSYYTKTESDSLLSAKQNVILSSTLSIGGQTETTVEGALGALNTAKQGTLTAGTNITIDANNVISATGGGGSVTGDTADCTTTFTSSDDAATTDTTTADMTSVSTLTSGETHASLFQKISKMFLNIRKLWNMVGSTDISDVGTTLTGAISSLNSNNPKLYYSGDFGSYTIEKDGLYLLICRANVNAVGNTVTVNLYINNSLVAVNANYSGAASACTYYIGTLNINDICKCEVASATTTLPYINYSVLYLGSST